MKSLPDYLTEEYHNKIVGEQNKIKQINTQRKIINDLIKSAQIPSNGSKLAPPITFEMDKKLHFNDVRLLLGELLNQGFVVSCYNNVYGQWIHINLKNNNYFGGNEFMIKFKN